MKEKIIGCIGTGNMGYAFISGMTRANIVPAENILVSGRNVKRLETIQEEFGVKATTKNQNVATVSDILILAVKPQQYKEIILEIKDCIKKKCHSHLYCSRY